MYSTKYENINAWEKICHTNKNFFFLSVNEKSNHLHSIWVSSAVNYIINIFQDITTSVLQLYIWHLIFVSTFYITLCKWKNILFTKLTYISFCILQYLIKCWFICIVLFAKEIMFIFAIPLYFCTPPHVHRSVFRPLFYR